MQLPRNSGLVLIALVITGCYPMEQAPLVYSSKNQFGVTVAAGTPDSPGLDVNIGFKALDAAFVPVAVSKYCPPDRRDCDKELYAVKIVTGKNSITGEVTIDEQQIVQTKADILKGREEQAAKLDELKAVNASLERLKTKSAKEAELAALQHPVDPATGNLRSLSTDEGQRQAALTSEIAALAKLNETTLQARANTLKSENDGIETRLKQLSALLERQIVQKNQHSGDAKDDSLSLYGSFNGNAGGKAEGASLALGKVFATGIAAQHIAQGVRDSTNPSLRAACLNSASKLIDSAAAADQAALRERLLEGCGIPK